MTNKKRKKVKYPKKYQNILLVSILLAVVVGLVFNIFTLNYFLSLSLHCETVIEETVVNEVVTYQNVVFLGDSITEVYDLEKYYTDDEWIIINSGTSGNTTADILKNLKKRAVQYRPGKIFLLIGTNDIGFGVKTQTTIDNIEKIVKELLDNCMDAELYIESIYPVNSELKNNKVGKRTNKVIKEINLQIEKIAADYEIEYIDLYSKLSDEDGNLVEEYTTDGLHLSEKGYEVVTNVLRTYL